MAPVQYHGGVFPPDNLDLVQLIPLIGPANAAVARYESLLHAIPNADILLSLLFTQEAVLSSKIEGTQATMGDVLKFEAAEDTAIGDSKRNDIQEVLNYRRAMNFAVREMQTVPLSQRLLKNTHTVLMQGVRGKNKAPGEYRKIPNWIGPQGCTVEQATFEPPGAHLVADCMSKWEKLIHSEYPDKLVQLALLHAEFEAIHPFLDGNGRLGRLLVPLFLVHKNILNSPNFYISSYLESNRDEYYERLSAVSRDGDWLGWCAFFLEAITEQAIDNEKKAKAVLSLYEQKKQWIAEEVHSQYAVQALDWFFNRPIFRTTDFVHSSTIPEPTANRIIRVVRDAGLLKVVRSSSGPRPAILAFAELLDIADGRNAP